MPVAAEPLPLVLPAPPGDSWADSLAVPGQSAQYYLDVQSRAIMAQLVWQRQVVFLLRGRGVEWTLQADSLLEVRKLIVEPEG